MQAYLAEIKVCNIVQALLSFAGGLRPCKLLVAYYTYVYVLWLLVAIV